MASAHILKCILLVGSAVLAEAQTRGNGECHRSTVEEFAPSLGPKARAFLAELKTAIKNGDRRKIATLVRYPFEVHFAKGKRIVRNSSQFVKDYDTLFTPTVRKAIEQQAPACLFANYQGIMIGDGEVWFNEQQNGSMKIKALNP